MNDDCILQVSSPQQEIVFSTWDLAGQHVYYATHQCFLTSNTLYLVVWNIEHGQEGIERLAPWLLNIQVIYMNVHFHSEALLENMRVKYHLACQWKFGGKKDRQEC